MELQTAKQLTAYFYRRVGILDHDALLEYGIETSSVTGFFFPSQFEKAKDLCKQFNNLHIISHLRDDIILNRSIPNALGYSIGDGDKNPSLSFKRPEAYDPDVEAFFNGSLEVHGVVKNRAGKVIRRFSADINAYWESDGVGVLEEDFVFDDGEKSRRVWRLTPVSDGAYIGTANDVVGEGKLEVAGNSMFLDYILQIPYGNGTLDLRIDDRMYLIDENVLINESRMLKFGVRVGELLLVIRKTGA